MARRAGNRKPYGRCLALVAGAVEDWAAVEGVLTRAGIDTRGYSLRRWLVVYEALLRERMDADQIEQFEADLDMASAVDERALDSFEKRDLMLAWGGDVDVVSD